ncbi:hypothetical protein ABBQ38_012265 [Trebouxia sp. C0009 RCD-2024]
MPVDKVTPELAVDALEDSQLQPLLLYLLKTKKAFAQVLEGLQGLHHVGGHREQVAAVKGAPHNIPFVGQLLRELYSTKQLPAIDLLANDMWAMGVILFHLLAAHNTCGVNMDDDVIFARKIPQRLPPKQREAPKALQVVTYATGRTRDKHGVCCHSSGGQHAHAQQQDPDISRLAPSLQQQWDYAANAHLGNIIIRPYSHKAVWWTCDQCPDGHRRSWHNSLATKAPLVAAQWDYEANDGTPDDVVAQSNQLAKWQCTVCGCRWEATPNARSAITPSWQSGTMNAMQLRGTSLTKVRLKSNKQIFWFCTKCPAGQDHSWLLADNSLQALYPETAAEWDYSRNQGQPSDYTASSEYLAWWSSRQRGSRQQTIKSRTTGPRQAAARLRRIEQGSCKQPLEIAASAVAWCSTLIGSYRRLVTQDQPVPALAAAGSATMHQQREGLQVQMPLPITESMLQVTTTLQRQGKQEVRVAMFPASYMQPPFHWPVSLQLPPPAIEVRSQAVLSLGVWGLALH